MLKRRAFFGKLAAAAAVVAVGSQVEVAQATPEVVVFQDPRPIMQAHLAMCKWKAEEQERVAALMGDVLAHPERHSEVMARARELMGDDTTQSVNLRPLKQHMGVMLGDLEAMGLITPTSL